jgi:hypothetical protein
MSEFMDAGNCPVWTAHASYLFMLADVAVIVETVGLPIGAGRPGFGHCSLRQNLGRDIINRGIGDLVNEADVLVLAGHNARDDFPPGDFGIDDGLASAPSIIDHHNEILHAALHCPGMEAAFADTIALHRLQYGVHLYYNGRNKEMILPWCQGADIAEGTHRQSG